MTPTRQIVRCNLAALSLACAGTAFAQQSPYYLGISQAFTHESNLFRTIDSAPKTSDTISTTSLLAGLSLPVSRQRFFGDAAVRYNKFSDQSQLDNTGYGLNVGWDWETINELSGRLNYSVNQTLASFSDVSGVIVTSEPNRERSQEFLARAQYGMHSLLSLETTYMHRSRDYSSPGFIASEFEQDSLRLGVLYRPSGLLTLGAGVRGTRGEYPRAIGAAPGPFTADKFDRNDLDLTAIWQPSGLSKLAARLSYSNEDHDQITTRDFSGVTGALTWEYKPTAKLTFTTDLIRDTGAEASFNGYRFVDASAAGDNSQLSEAVQLRASYEATAKINLTGSARYIQRDLIPTGNDKTALFSLGATWAPTRNWTLGCSIGYEKRGGGALNPYTADIASCSAQFALR